MNTKNKIIIIILAALITITILVFIVLPTGKKIKQLNNDIYNQRIALEKLYLRGQSIKESRENYNKIKNQIEIFDSAFNHLGQELEFITSLEKIANQQNIKQIINMKDNQKDKNTSTNDYKIIPVELTLNGTFPNILAYLDQIQTLDYYFNINYLNFYHSKAEPFEKIDLSKSPAKQFKKSYSSPTINVTISGLTYWR